jgi:hypothetical protein
MDREDKLRKMPLESRPNHVAERVVLLATEKAYEKDIKS